MIDDEMAQYCFAARLRAASRAITRRYDHALRALDLKISQAAVLTAASLGGGDLTIVDMADRLAMDRSTLSRNLDPLVRRGLIAVGPEERHRARRVALTEAGRALLEAVYPLWQAAQREVAAEVPEMAEIVQRLDPVVARFR
jgi:DNA-binding MarR family transcriptional regulator